MKYASHSVNFTSQEANWLQPPPLSSDVLGAHVRNRTGSLMQCSLTLWHHEAGGRHFQPSFSGGEIEHLAYHPRRDDFDPCRVSPLPAWQCSLLRPWPSEESHRTPYLFCQEPVWDASLLCLTSPKEGIATNHEETGRIKPRVGFLNTHPHPIKWWLQPRRLP